jgi:hypothetical protein
MIWLFAFLGLLALGLGMFLWDVQRLKRKPAPWRLEYMEWEVRRQPSVRDRLAMRIHRGGDHG